MKKALFLVLSIILLSFESQSQPGGGCDCNEGEINTCGPGVDCPVAEDGCCVPGVPINNHYGYLIAGGVIMGVFLIRRSMQK